MISLSTSITRPEPVIAARQGDDEILLDALPGTAGEQPADLLQGLAEFDREKVAAHQAADGFAGQQLGGEGLEQGAGDQVAMHDAHGSFVGIQHGDRVQAGLQAKGFQHLGDRPLGRHRRLAYEQGGKIAGFLVESVLLRLRRAALRRYPGRELLRAAEQIALDGRHPSPTVPSALPPARCLRR